MDNTKIMQALRQAATDHQLEYDNSAYGAVAAIATIMGVTPSSVYGVVMQMADEAMKANCAANGMTWDSDVLVANIHKLNAI